MTTDILPAFFTRDRDAYAPGPHARGPWDPNVLHGRLVAGLAAGVVEQRHGKPDFVCSRLTVDLFRPPPMARLDVRTNVVREGNRISVVDAIASSGGVDCARATAVLLKRTDEPPGRVWKREPWDVPHPDDIEPQQIPSVTRPGTWFPMWETRPITPGGWGAFERRRCWLRENRTLVEGEPLTPLVRVAVAADYTSPFANSGDQGLNWINADITVYLHRLPAGEWIGFEVASHGSSDGVAIGSCTLYDTSGPIGESLVCALAQRPRNRPG